MPALIELPLVSLQAVTLTTEGRPILEDISLEVRPHEIWQIHGAAGSGKSTLLELLLGRHHITTGHRSYPAFEGRFPDAALGIAPRFALRLVSSEEQRRTALAQTSFYQARWHSQWTEPETVSEFLLPERVLGLRAFEVLVDLPVRRDFDAERERCLVELGLSDRQQRAVGQLSNGELRKLLLLAAHLAAPALLLLDCPLGGLDPEARRQAKNEIQRWCREGQTLVFCSTHDDDLDDLATHRLELERGRQRAYSPQDAPPRGEAHDTVPAPICAALTKPSAGAPPILRCRDVRVAAYGTIILEAINWEVYPGEHWIITGPNGAGKSTLLALLMGDHPQAYSNDVEVFGKRLGRDATLWDRRASIGYVAPELGWHYPTGWTAEQVVLSGLDSSIGSYRDTSEAERAQALGWLDRFGLTRSSSQCLAVLSEGERRLVLLARALVRQPPLLLLDEPTQELAEPDRRRFFDALSPLAASRATNIVLVTHHFEDRPGFINRHLALDRGRVVTCAQLDASA